MASKKKDGGAERAKARRTAANKRKEKKYGLEGFTKQAEKNLKSPRYIPTARQSGMGIINASGFGATNAAVNVVAKSGIAAKAWNKVTRQVIMVHGTPKTIVGNRLKPFGGSVFGWNPRALNAKSRLPVSAAKYSKNTGRGSIAAPQNNVVIAKVKKSKTNLGKPGSSPDIIISKSPAKIVKIVKSEKATYAKELEDALRRAGAPLRGPKKATKKK